MTELEEEKEELRIYYDLDRDRRSLEYTIYQRELADVNEQLEHLEEDRQAQVGNAAQMRHQASDRERLVVELEGELKQARQALLLHQQERSTLKEECDEQTKALAHVELMVKDLEENARQSTQNQNALEKELQLLQKEIASKEKLLADATAAMETSQAKEDELLGKMNEMSQRRDLLVAKRGRASQFRNKKERDDYLKQEIQSVTSSRKSLENQTQLLKREIDTLRERLRQQEQDAEKLRTQMSDIQKSLASETDGSKKVRQQSIDLNMKRKELWRQDAQLDASIASNKEEYRRSSRSLFGTIDRVCLSDRFQLLIC